ncbi:hypothetical protein SETIT_9G571200v2 [Setaria italica]|uniref:Uncharacterized protein n=1 Tax=Setaria italica TaxID=4555 RepID=A0A368SWX7_SETIT|nr:hypothetical protein SETIT_9G571200v2 [Setaria italica]
MLDVRYSGSVCTYLQEARRFPHAWTTSATCVRNHKQSSCSSFSARGVELLIHKVFFLRMSGLSTPPWLQFTSSHAGDLRV